MRSIPPNPSLYGLSAPQPGAVVEPWPNQRRMALYRPAHNGAAVQCRQRAALSMAVASIGWLLAAAGALYWSLFLNEDWAWLVVETLHSWEAHALLRELPAPGGVPWKQVVAGSFAAATCLLAMSRMIHGCSCGRHSWLSRALTSAVVSLMLATSVTSIGLAAWRTGVAEDELPDPVAKLSPLTEHNEDVIDYHATYSS